ncbi:hypothetical protein E2I00_016928, partial [Balaenoptera physalus]
KQPARRGSVPTIGARRGVPACQGQWEKAGTHSPSRDSLDLKCHLVPLTAFSMLLRLFICKCHRLVLQDVKVFSEDGTSKVVEILADTTARDLCQLLVYRKRCLEDHELVVQVESTMASESKFLFRKNYAKYEFFKNPTNFFPEQMVTWCQQSNGSQTQLLQNFLNSSSCPEIQGFLHVKELGRKSWKKLYVCLRRSGLYCSTKGASKEPRHLQLLADLEDSRIFSLMASRKQYGAPTDYGFCIKACSRVPVTLTGSSFVSFSQTESGTRPRSCGCSVPRTSRAGPAG